MTVIAGLETDTGVWVGYDSAITAGDDLDATDAKVFRVFAEHEVWIGVAGEWRLCDALRNHLKINDAPDREDPRAWVSGYVAPRVKQICRRKKISISARSASGGSDVVVVTSGALIYLDEDWSAHRSAWGYAAVGSGAAVALGSLASTQRMRPDNRVRAAVDAACRHVSTVAAPVHLKWVPA